MIDTGGASGTGPAATADGERHTVSFVCARERTAFAFYKLYI